MEAPPRGTSAAAAPSTQEKGPPLAFPSKGDRVAHGEYGPGTITDLDVYHTVIDFDAHGIRRFVTSRVVLERTSDPGPTAAERREASARRTRAAGRCHARA